MKRSQLAESESRVAVLEANFKAEQEKLRDQRNAAAKIEHPLNVMLDKRRLIQKNIARCEEKLPVLLQDAAEYRRKIQAQFAQDDEGVGSLWKVHLHAALSNDPYQEPAERLATACAEFIQARKSDLANLECEISAYAEKHDLKHLLQPAK